MTILDGSGMDPNKILPMRYPWARKHYLTGVQNNWVPTDIPMQNDIELWKSRDGLTEAERRLIMLNMGFFSTAESLTANNLVLAVYNHVKAPECRQYLLRQAYEEAVHTDTFIYCCDSLGLDPDEVYGMYLTSPTIAAKDKFCTSNTRALANYDYNKRVVDPEGFVPAVLKDLITFYIIMEGIFFYAGFVMMLNFRRDNRMVGVSEQFQYILRDEAIHVSFGLDLIRTIRAEYPEVWTHQLQSEVGAMISEAVLLEQNYIDDCLPGGSTVFGISRESLAQYILYIAQRRYEQLDLWSAPVARYPNPFPWMSELTDLNQEKNFFESRVTSYRTGGLRQGW